MNALVRLNFDDFRDGAGKRALGYLCAIANSQVRLLLKNTVRITARK